MGWNDDQAVDMSPRSRRTQAPRTIGRRKTPPTVEQPPVPQKPKPAVVTDKPLTPPPQRKTRSVVVEGKRYTFAGDATTEAITQWFNTNLIPKRREEQRTRSQGAPPVQQPLPQQGAPAGSAPSQPAAQDQAGVTQQGRPQQGVWDETQEYSGIGQGRSQSPVVAQQPAGQQQQPAGQQQADQNTFPVEFTTEQPKAAATLKQLTGTPPEQLTPKQLKDVKDAIAALREFKWQQQQQQAKAEKPSFQEMFLRASQP